MTSNTPRRDHRGIITADTLRTWTGTDSELARRLGVTRQAVCYARRVHKIPAPFDGNTMASPTLSKTFVNALVREVKRRGGPDADDASHLDAMRAVCDDLRAWVDGGAR